MFKKVYFSSRMLPVSKDTLVMFGVIVCIMGIFYLYREMQKLKKMSVVKPTQQVPVFQNWTPAPVNEAKQAPPQPPAAPAASAASAVPVTNTVEAPKEE